MKKETASPAQIISPSRYRARQVQTVKQVLDEEGQSFVSKGTVPSSYVSGNPTIKQPWESTAGSKTHKVVNPLSNRQGVLSASESIAYGSDPDGNKFVQGKLVDVSAVKVDADYIMGLRPVAPGNTVLVSANTEQSTTSATLEKKKDFFVTRPGKYRVTFELSRTGSTTNASVVLRYPDGTYVAAGALQTYSGTVYPTFGSKTVDMTVDAWWGCQIAILISNDSGPGQTGYIKNVVLKYQDATASLSPQDTVLLD